MASPKRKRDTDFGEVVHSTETVKQHLDAAKDLSPINSPEDLYEELSSLPCHPLLTAINLEDECYQSHFYDKLAQPYLTHVKTLLFYLQQPTNESLRLDLLTGYQSCESLVYRTLDET